MSTPVPDEAEQLRDTTRALRESDARFRELADAMPQIVWVSRGDGSGLEYINARWLAYTGLGYDESTRDPNAPIHPDDRAGAESAWAEALRTGEPYALEMRLRHASGTYRWFLVRCVPMRGPAGEVARWYGTSTDIHEQREAAEDARFLADIAEIIRLAADPAELMDRVTAAVGEHLQVRRSLLIEIDVPADRALVRSQHCRGADPVEPEYRISGYSAFTLREMAAGRAIVNCDSATDSRTADAYEATYRPYGERAYVAMPMLRDGRWTGELWVSDDQPRQWQQREIRLLEALAERAWLALERLRAEQALRAYAVQLQELNAASLAINAAVGMDEVLWQITEQARLLIGAHQSVASLKVSDQWEEAIVAASLSDKYAAWRSYTARTDGSGIYALVSSTSRPMRLTQAELEAHPAWRGFGAARAEHPPMRGWLAVPITDSDGRSVGLIQLSDKEEGDFTATDEGLLVQLARLAAVAIENVKLYEAEQDAVRVRDQFLSVAAHELKTPLTSILGYSQALLRRVERDASLVERDQRMLRQTAAQAARLNRLIDALLDVGRIETGRLSIEREPLDLRALLGRIVEEVQPTLERHTLELRAPADAVPISGDALRLEQVLQNLIGNAVKYSPAGGAVLVTLAAGADTVEITVSDQGIGIPPSAIPHLFQRFYRVNGTSEQHIAGMGIGLFVVKEIVSLHGGSVTVASAEGAGSTFTVTLPRA